MKRDHTTGGSAGTNFCYYYLHVNGELHMKTKLYHTESFEESDFVKCWWKIDLDSRSDAYKMLIAASTRGAHDIEVDRLVQEWQIDDKDCEVYLRKEGLSHKREGMYWKVWVKGKREAGMSNSLFRAVCLYYESLITVGQL